MLDVIKSTRINTDASEEDIRPGEYRDALNMQLIADGAGAFSKGTTYGNIDTNIIFNGLQADAICLGTAIDNAGKRMIVTFYQQTPFLLTVEYQGVLDYAVSRGYTVPSPTVQRAQNFLITLMMQDGIWSGLDVFYCFYGDGDADFARINWKLPNDATTAVNWGMTYAVNWGFKGNGIDAYMDTLWLPSAAPKFTLNNAGFVIGAEEIFLNATGFDGVKSGSNRTYIGLQVSANSVFFPINSATDTPGYGNAELGTGAGLYFVGRSASNVTSLRKNTGTSFAGSIVSSAEPTNSFYIGALHDGGATSFNTNRYSMFAAGEYLNTFDRETKFYANWMLYKNSFITPLVSEAYGQEVLMYLLPDIIAGEVQPLVKSALMRVSERSYLDGYQFINDQFYFNFRESAPKVINIQRALDSPGFYDKLNETSLTVIKPHPPYSPSPSRNIGSVVNAPIQGKPYQFMMIYHFLDGEQSTKSPASVYVNAMDYHYVSTLSYDTIYITMRFPLKDYSIVKEVELFMRNNNAIADWRSVKTFPKTDFVQAGENYQLNFDFQDNVVGNFFPLELSTKINDAVPQRSNYLAFIENRIFVIDSLIDYDFSPIFQIKIDIDIANPTIKDDRLNAGIYALAEFEYDSEYTIGLAFFDKYGRKYPATVCDKKLITPQFVPCTTPPYTSDVLPDGRASGQLLYKKITAKYDLRAAGNIANYGKPPAYAYWWSMIRGKNTKWEFQQAIQCLLRFPYSLTKWPDTDPANFPFAAQGLLFLEDGYLYWDPNKLLTLSPPLVDGLVNDYIDIVIPPSFPYPLDKTVLVDFMFEVITKTSGLGGRTKILNREVIDVIANKIRIRGDRNARWFSSVPTNPGQYRAIPKFTTGINLTPPGSLTPPASSNHVYRDETTFPLIIKRRRQSNLESIILYDTPTVYPVKNPGTRFATFQQTQNATIQRAEFAPNAVAPVLNRTLDQGDILIQPVMLTPTTVAFNHAIKITWGVNTGDSLRLKIKVSLWQLNDLNQPILELYSATGDTGGPYYVKDSETVEYLIDADAELINGWYGYGIQILSMAASNVQFFNPLFDFHNFLELEDWENSIEAGTAWTWFSVDGVDNVAFMPIAGLGTAWSRTLYQYMHQITKNDLTVEVVIEGVGIVGPPEIGAISEYPGNLGVLPPVTGPSPESMVNKGRNIVPYYIDCPGGRVVTLNTLNFTTSSIASPGTQVKAEIWRLDQFTKAPTTMISGSAGVLTAISSAAGANSAPFGATNIIDTTGWYGMALYLDAPVFSDFTDKSYNTGAGPWTVKAGSPTWAFQADTAISPVYATPGFAPPIGADQGYKPLITMQHIVTPIFIPPGTDPAGYDQWVLFVEWGDNTQNGWDNKTVTIGFWEVHPVTKVPTTYAPVATASMTIKSVTSSTFLTATMLLGNKWYAWGLGAPSGHPAPTATQFINPKMNTATNWTITAGTSASWTPATSGTDVFFKYTYPSIGSFSAGGFAQTIAGYVRVFLPSVLLTGTFGDLTATLKIGGVVKQTLTLPLTSGVYFSVLFDCFYANGAVVEVSMAGTSMTAINASISVLGIMNNFNPYYFDTPKVRYYTKANNDNESWRNYGAGVLDPRWKLGTNSWGESTEYQTNGATLFDRHVPDVAEPAVVVSLQCTLPSPNSVSNLYFGNINMTEVVGNIQFNHILNAKTSSGIAVLWEVWVFNTFPDYETTGVQIASIPWNTSGAHTNNYMLNVPGGYRYIGYRAMHDVGAFGPNTISVSRSEFIPQAAYNTWYKTNSTLSVSVQGRQITNPAYTQIANFRADNIAYNATSAKIGQPSLVGTIVRANIEVYAGQTLNSYELQLYDNANVLIGKSLVVNQALSVQPLAPVNPQITIIVDTPPTTTGLFLAVQNKTAAGPISVRIRQITNVDSAITLASNNTGAYANARTWRRDVSNNNTQLSTTSVTRVDGTDNVSLMPEQLTVVLADASGVEISAPQPFVPNDGTHTLIFSPNLQADLNYNYGVKVKNGLNNNQVSGHIRIHSMMNVASNDGVANIIGNTINPAQPLYEAWNQFSLGAFVRAGYVSNFIAVVSDLVVSAFTPVQIDPTSFHLVHDMVPAAIDQHSTAYGDSTLGERYNYGPTYPSAASDPDAAGIVYEMKTGQSIGDINIKITDLGEKSNSNIVRWSDTVIIGTGTNNLNAFLDSNKYPVDFQRGAIQVMQAMHDHTLFCVHEQGMSSLYVQRSLMSSPAAEGEDQLFLTSKIIGSDNKLTSNLGTVNPESVRIVESGTVAYGFDLIRKSFWQKTNNGVRNLTYECQAKSFFMNVCFHRLKAYHEGEDVKIYTGYNEKQKSFYLTFAPFIYQGQPYPAITVAYNAYIDGFISRYSFEPISYLATEDVIHTIKAREMNDPDFLGDFDFWEQNDSTGTAIWINSLTAPGHAEADTTVPGGTRILNPDFIQGGTFWSSYGAGIVVDLWILASGFWDSGGLWEDADIWRDTPPAVAGTFGAAWVFTNDGAESTIPAGNISNELVNASGAPGTYLVRVNAKLPTTDFLYSLKVYNVSGAVLETLLPETPMTGDDIVQVTQTFIGRIGISIRNIAVGSRTVHLNLVTTVVRSQLLYQPMPVIEEELRVRLVIPPRLGSIHLLVYAFNDPESPFQELLQDVDLIRLKDKYVVTANVPNTLRAKYIGLYTITDYDVTLLNYFNVNSVPSIWAHDQKGRTNNFYGVQYDSAIELVFGVREGQVRIFNSVGIASETAWSVERIVTSEGHISALGADNFRQRDGVYSAAILRDILTPQDALPDPVNNKAILHGTKLTGTSITMVLRNSETLRQIELEAVYIGSEELAGNFLARK